MSVGNVDFFFRVGEREAHSLLDASHRTIYTPDDDKEGVVGELGSGRGDFLCHRIYHPPPYPTTATLTHSHILSAVRELGTELYEDQIYRRFL